MAKYIIVIDGGRSVSLEASGAEAAKIDAFNYSGGLKFTDDDGIEHNMNNDAIMEIKKLP